MSINRITLCLSLVLAIGLSACSSTRKQMKIPERAPTAKVRKHYLKPDDIRRVRTGEFVKTYHIGRSVSGRTGSTMHEAHRVYRLEKPSRWSLGRDQPPLASTGPVNRVIDSAFKPAPESQAIRAELNRQREAAEELEHARDELEDVLGTARAKLSDSSKHVGLMDSLKQEVKQLRTENEALRQSKSANGNSAIEKPEKPADALRQWDDGLDSTPSDKGEQGQ